MKTPAIGAEPRVHPSIRMGEMRVGRGDLPLKTLLGSCLGLALYCRRVKIGGLAHIVLPESPGQEGPAGKYVDTAIPELIRRIESAGGESCKLRAKIAGGANMFATQSALTIGDRNLEMTRRLLGELRVSIDAEHCGGTQGRRMTFYPSTGRVTIEIVGSESVDL